MICGYTHRCRVLIYCFMVIMITSCDETNTAPEILPLSELLAPVNQSAELNIFARDAEGDPLTFSFTFDPLPQVFTEGALGRPTLTPLATQQALFQWVPSIADVGAYSLTITVTDPRGLSASETIRIEVFSEEISDASMRFSSPIGAGQSLNLDQEPCLMIPIVVTADGVPAEEVLIDLPETDIAGVTLDPPGSLTGKERRLRWCPSTAQIIESARYTLTLRARRRLISGGVNEDMTSEVWSEGIQKRYLIRLEGGSSPDQTNCVGRPPTLTHTPPERAGGLNDYPVLLNVRDDLGIKSPPLLAVWPNPSTPNVDLDDPRWSLSELSPDPSSTNLWRGTIPNLNLTTGEESFVYYAFIVTDNDDAMGARCDNTVESSIYELRVTGGSEGGGRPVCAPCSYDTQCGGELDLCLVYTEGQYCGRYCDSMTPCLSDQECLALTSPEGQMLSQCVPSTLMCTPQCTPDAFDMTPELDAANAPLISEGLYPDLALCDADLDLYQLEIPPGRGVEVELSFDAATLDFDLFLALGGEVNAEGQLVFQYESASPNRSPERIRVGCASPDADTERAWIAVLPYDQGDRGAYQLRVSLPPEGCQVPCQDDELESPGAASISDGVYQDLQLCPGDQDFFVFEVEAGWVISALFSFNHENGDLDVSLFGPAQELIIRDDGSRSGSLIEWRAERTGIYALEVSGATNLTQNQYDLDLYLFPTDPCQDTLDCPPESFCYPQLGCLTDPCDSTLGCGPDHLCIYPTSLSPSADEGRCGARCDTDFDCRGYERCKLLGSGESVCVEAGLERERGDCAQHQDCSADLICADLGSRGVCTRAGCTACLPNEQCVSISSMSYCLPSCDQGCPTGWSCEASFNSEVCLPQ